WDRALVLRDLDLPLASAEAWDAAAALAEPGWSGEAARRATDLRAELAAREARWNAVRTGCPDGLTSDKVPAAAVIDLNPAACRAAFYEALRLAPTRAAVDAFVPMAEALDRAAADGSATAWLRRIAGKDFGARAAAVAAYRKVTRTPNLGRSDKERLL